MKNNKTMKTKLFFTGLLMIALAYACSKDQKVVRQLSGTWKVSDYTIDGKQQDKSSFSGQTYEFEKCKVKKEMCSGRVNVPDSTKGTITFEFKYRIREKGNKIDIQINFFGLVSETQTGDIKEHSKKKFRYSYKSDNEEHEITMEKQ